VKYGGDQLKMRVVTMFGVGQDLGKRHVEPFDIDAPDPGRSWPAGG
jgi:hypothetical protein